MNQGIQAVLFDLDGTFADTAPDLGRTINIMREARGLTPVPLSDTRSVTSLGARGLLRVGFNITPEAADYEALRQEFLALYAANLCHLSTLFPGIAPLVDTLEMQGQPWGIVTNKAEELARPLLTQLGYAQRAACIIGGNTTPHLKPHPEPLLTAARQINIAPQHCLYVGDDLRDIQAGRAAGMRTVGVRYGYLNGSDPDSWGADFLVNTADEISALLQ
jgi:phosphoglycolate phosphatase